MKFNKMKKTANQLGLRWLYDFIKNIREELINFRLMENSRQGSTLLSRRASRSLIHHYTGDASQLADDRTGFLGFGLIHYAFIRNLRPRRILCIGSKGGFIPALCALACKDNHYGHVDFVDPGFGPKDPVDKYWGGTGFWQTPAAKNHFLVFKLQDWLTLYPFTSKVFNKKYPRHKYDYIYLDGDHSYEGVKLDYQMFWPKLNKNGLLSLHDIIVQGYYKDSQCHYGVFKLWQELPENHKIKFPFPKNSGLGFLQK